MSRRFMISSLLAAGFGHNDALQASLTRATSTGETDNKNLFQVFRQDHLYTLAGHSSHSSHSSHASHSSGSGGYSGGHFSHTSHYSSTGGYSLPSYTPEPVYSAPPTSPQSSPSPAPQPLSGNTPSSPSSSLKPLPGHSALFKSIVKRLQVGLMGRGLFEGPINGTVGPSTRGAIRKFQETQGLQVTGTITPETLDALHVPSS
jgi:hypothetical protein